MPKATAVMEIDCSTHGGAPFRSAKTHAQAATAAMAASTRKTFSVVLPPIDCESTKDTNVRNGWKADWSNVSAMQGAYDSPAHGYVFFFERLMFLARWSAARDYPLDESVSV